MRLIPPKLKEQINKDPFFRKCCITGSSNVSIEHCWIYAGRQINELWALVPLRRDLNTSHPPKHIKEKCQLISLNRATEKDLLKYPRKDWKQIKYALKNTSKTTIN